jgi:hypothetical protein
MFFLMEILEAVAADRKDGSSPDVGTSVLVEYCEDPITAWRARRQQPIGYQKGWTRFGFRLRKPWIKPLIRASKAASWIRFASSAPIFKIVQLGLLTSLTYQLDLFRIQSPCTLRRGDRIILPAKLLAEIATPCSNPFSNSCCSTHSTTVPTGK